MRQNTIIDTRWLTQAGRDSRGWRNATSVRGVTVLSAVLLFVALLAGCDSAPGTVDLNASPPRVFDLSFSPDSLDLISIDQSLIVGDSVYIDLAVGVSATDNDGDLQTVAFTLLPPLRTDTPVAFGTLSATSGDRYETNQQIVLPVGQTGNYVLTVYASDATGLLSNQARGTVELAASVGFGSPPVVESVVASPNPLTPPATLRVLATVSDEQGLSNILSVVVDIQGVEYTMSDDGESLGDSVSGDGIYTASFNVPSGVLAGTEVLRVQAFDRNGNQSEIVSTELTIQ